MSVMGGRECVSSFLREPQGNVEAVQERIKGIYFHYETCEKGRCARYVLRLARAGTGGRQQLLERVLGIIELLTKGKVLRGGNSIWGRTGGCPRVSWNCGVGGEVADVHS